MLEAPTLHDVLLTAGIRHTTGRPNSAQRNFFTCDGEPLGSYAAHEAWAVIKAAPTGDLISAFRAASQKAAA